MNRVSARFESFVITVLQLLLMVFIAVAIVELCRLVYRGLAANWFGVGTANFGEIANVADLQRILQHSFAGVLLILLGLELLDTLRSYFNEHRIRLEIILVVAMIAVGRHIILLDFDDLNGLTLTGIAALVVALTSGYFLIRKSAARAGNGQ